MKNYRQFINENNTNDLETWFRALNYSDYATIKKMLVNGMDPNIPFKFSSSNSSRVPLMPVTPLQLAVRIGKNLKIIKLLLEFGAEVNQIANGSSALLEAVIVGNCEAVQYLIKQGAALEFKNKQGETPLYKAVQLGYKSCVESLLAAGAQHTPEKFNKFYPLHIVDKVEIMELLLKYFEPQVKNTLDSNPLLWHSYGCNKDLVKLLMKDGRLNWLATDNQGNNFISILKQKNLETDTGLTSDNQKQKCLEYYKWLNEYETQKKLGDYNPILLLDLLDVSLNNKYLEINTRIRKEFKYLFQGKRTGIV
jgi:ankyrin repeat protein